MCLRNWCQLTTILLCSIQRFLFQPGFAEARCKSTTSVHTAPSFGPASSKYGYKGSRASHAVHPTFPAAFVDAVYSALCCLFCCPIHEWSSLPLVLCVQQFGIRNNMVHGATNPTCVIPQLPDAISWAPVGHKCLQPELQ